MKKTVFFTLLSFLVLSSCTKQFELEEPQSTNPDRGTIINPDVEFADVLYFDSEIDLQEVLSNGDNATSTRSATKVRSIADVRKSIEARMDYIDKGSYFTILKETSIYGSLKYNGQWKGIRFLSK